MIANFLLPVALSFITLRFPIHGLGIFSMLLVCHGLIYDAFGSVVSHFPFYGGLGVAVALALRDRWRMPSYKISISILSLAMIMGISASLALDHGIALQFLLLYLKCFLLALLIACALKTRMEVIVLSSYLLSAILIGSVAACYQQVMGNMPVANAMIQRATTLRSDPNDTAMILVAGIPLAMFWIFSAKNRGLRLLNVVFLISILMAIALTGSRGGFVAMALVLLAMLVKFISPKVVLLGVLIILAFAVLNERANYWDRIETLHTGNEHGASIKHRLNLLKKGSIILMEHPIFGVGPGNFPVAYAQASKDSILFKANKGGVAHNMYLDFAVENGLIGLFFFVFLIFFALSSLLRLSRARVRLDNSASDIGYHVFLSLCGMLIGGLFLSQGKNSVLWFLLGLGFSAFNILRIESSEGEEIPLTRQSRVDKIQTYGTKV